MSPDQEHRLEAIFTAARDLPPQERTAFLERACGGDAELRRGADSLLEAHQRAGRFLEPMVALSMANGPVEKPGDHIGRYKLLEQIGEGGFGVVWMAEQEEPMRRRVALKIIKLGMDTREVVARFEAERQALAMMDHPNIARVFDGGATDAGRPYFVMELVKGVPITEYCDASKLCTRERLILFVQVCHAVQHAHQKGVIHRDLKPSNILVTVQDDRPVPKVIDFGVAKATQARLTEKTLFTGFQQWIGTPAYMSPEQAGLGSFDVDTRSDIYSLGVLLYELLTGVTPFDRETLAKAAFEEIRRIIRETEPAIPSTRVQTLGQKLADVARQRKTEPTALSRLIRGDLDWIVMKALEKDRTRRYETADSLAMDLERHLRNEPVSAAAPGLSYKVTKFVRRHKAGLASAAALALALVAGLVASLWQAGVARQAQRSAESARLKEAQLRQLAEQEELNARRNLYAADMNLANQALEAGNWGRARTLLMAHEPAQGQEDLRGFEWRYLWAATRGDSFAALRGHSNVITSVAVSPDGKTALSGSQDQTVRLWDLRSGQCVGVLPRFERLVYSVAFSPDGKIFAVGNGDSVSLWRTETRERFLVIAAQHCRVAFSPVGTLLAYGTSTTWWQGDGVSVTVVDYSNGQQVAFFDGGGSHAVFSRDGKLLALAGRNDGVRILDLGSREEVAVLPKRDVVLGLAFNADNSNVVATYGNGESYVWDVPTQRVRTALTGHAVAANRVWEVAFSPDGHTMATVSSDQTVRLWDGATWKARRVLHGHGSEVWTAAFTPDGRTLVTGSKDETLMLFPLTRTFPPEVIRDLRSLPRISSNGLVLAALGAGGRVTLWDVPARRVTGSLPTTDLPLGFVPNSGSLVVLGKPAVLRVWDTSSGALQSETALRGDQAVSWAVLSPDARTLATGIGTPNGRVLPNIDLTGRVHFWDTHDGKLRGFVDGHTGDAETFVFSADSQRFFTVHNTSGQVWDLSSLQRVATLGKHKMYISTCAWSPSGKSLATGSADATVIVWDTASGKDLATLTGDMQGVGRVAFSRDGRTLATTGSRILKLWNLATQREAATLTRLEGNLDLLFALEDRELLVGSGGTFQLLHAPPLAEIEASSRQLQGWDER